MSRIIRTAKLLRRHWKKSTFFFGVLAYGTSHLVERYKTFEMMRAYCEEARKYGEKPLSQMGKPKHVTVILNPEANNKKCNAQFEKFAAPLLHLAGFKVSIFQTEKEKQAQELMEVMSNTDAVLIAGGDGTLHEAVTGLLRRPYIQNENLPLGVVPLGKTNTVAQYLFQPKSSSRAQLMAEAVMAVIRETTVKLDVLKIQYSDETKPLFAMYNFEQGIFADVDPLVQKYWYLGFLKDKFAYFINSLKEWKGVEIEKLQYVLPCEGCSKCYTSPKRKEMPEYSGRWWQAFVRKTESKDSNSSSANEKYLSTRVNENCGKLIELPPSFSNLTVSTVSADPTSKNQTSSLWIKIFPKDLSKPQFISSGLSHRKSKHHDNTGNASIVNAREIILQTTKLEQVKPAVMYAEKTELDVAEKEQATFDYAEKEQTTFDSAEKEEQTTFDSTEKEQTTFDSAEKEQTTFDSAEKEQATFNDLNLAEQTVSNVAYQNEETASLVSDLPQEYASTILNQSEQTVTLNETHFAPTDQAAIVHSQPNQKESNLSIMDRDATMSIPNSSNSSTENEAHSGIQTTTETLDNPEKLQYSYIDKEKYRRASCTISLLPKQVTMYG